MQEFYQYFEVDVYVQDQSQIKISNQYCGGFPEEQKQKLSQWYEKERQKFCSKYNEEQVKQNN